MGPLDTEAVTDGIHAARKAAVSLLSDAQLLFDNGRWARAIALAILAMEEIGKISALVAIGSIGEDSLRAAWQNFRSHSAKNAILLMVFGLLQKPGSLPDLLEWVDARRDIRQDIDRMKQFCLYS